MSVRLVSDKERTVKGVQGSPAVRRPWLALGLLSCFSMFNALDRNILGILADPIRRELHLTGAQTGLLTGLVFSIVYGLSALPIARIADRGDRVKVVTIAIAFWSIMTVLCGSATTFGRLLIVRMGVAVGEAGFSPGSYSLISDYFAPRQRARAMSTISIAIALGTLVSFVVGGQIAQHVNWRVAFVVVGVPGLLLGGVGWFLLPEPRRRARFQRVAEEGPPRTATADIVQLFSKPAFVALVAGVCALQFSLNALVIWSASLLQHVFHWSVGSAGLALGLTFGIGGMVSPVAMSVVGDRLLNDDAGAYPKLLGAGALLAAPALAVGLMSSNAAFTVFAIASAYILTACYSPLVMAAIRLLVEARQMAIAVGILGVAMNFLGGGFGPLAVGALEDALRAWLGEAAFRYALLPAVASYLLAAALLFHATRCMRRASLDLRAA